MEAIKNKVIPIFYDHINSILYFDGVDGEAAIQTQDFKYLKQVEEHEFFSYKIDFKELPQEQDTSNLTQLVKNIQEAILQNKLLFGVPIGFVLAEGKMEKLKHHELKKLQIDKKYFGSIGDNKHTHIPTEDCDSTSTKLLKVGQGLSVYDELNSFIMDVGGTVHYSDFRNQIETKKYTIVISHWHYDHYNYLNKMIDEQIVTKIIFPSTLYASNKVIELVAKIKEKEITCVQIKPGKKIETNCWNIKSPKGKRQFKNLNLSSLMSHNGNWVLTGDQSYKRIRNNMESVVGDNINLQVPHHGSASQETSCPQKEWSTLNEKVSAAYISCGKNNRYSHPHKKIKSFFNKKIIKITE